MLKTRSLCTGLCCVCSVELVCEVMWWHLMLCNCGVVHRELIHKGVAVAEQMLHRKVVVPEVMHVVDTDLQDAAADMQGHEGLLRECGYDSCKHVCMCTCRCCFSSIDDGESDEDTVVPNERFDEVLSIYCALHGDEESFMSNSDDPSNTQSNIFGFLETLREAHTSGMLSAKKLEKVHKAVMRCCVVVGLCWYVGPLVSPCECVLGVHRAHSARAPLSATRRATPNAAQ